MNTYYNPDDLEKFASMGELAPDLWEKFMAYYSAVFDEGALTKREKALIALAVAERGVEIVCSLPFYSENDCDRQRGAGTFKIIIAMLKKLNALGYGTSERLPLDLVYNPGGAFLPPNQSSLEREYKARLKSEHNIEFTNLFAITNNPIGRFREFLDRSGNYDKYMKRLFDSFNPEALPGMMCRFQISVGCDGRLYDCDFNQPLGLAIDEPDNISKVNNISQLTPRKIKFADHCYACVAGNGSSCGGTTA